MKIVRRHNVWTAWAGPYADDLGKCFVQQTSSADRQQLIQWFFSALSEHPAVKTMVSVNEQQRTDIEKGVAKMVERLIFSSCRIESEQAIRFEGPQTMVYAFQVLGQASTVELMRNQAVMTSLERYTKYLDNDKLKSFTANAIAAAPTTGDASSTPVNGAAKPDSGNSTSKP